MVQIKKKVTLRIKTVSDEMSETVQRPNSQPTLRKKIPEQKSVPTPESTSKPTPKPTPKPTSNSQQNTEPKPKTPFGGNGKFKMLGFVIIVCLLGYGAYSMFTPSDDDNNGQKIENIADADINDVAQADEESSDSITAGEPETVGEEGDINGESIKQPEANAGLADNSIEPTSKSSNSTQNKQIQKSSETQPTVLTGTLEDKASEVIRGRYGNGEVRKQKLGERYTEIQNKVNEMYRKGLVK